MSYNLLDAAVIAVILISTILAYSRGMVREGMSLLGWIIALIIAAQFARLVIPFIEDLPFIRDYVADSCGLMTVIGFVILFIIMMIIMSLVTPLFSNLVKNSFFGVIDSGLGGIFGFIRGTLIVLLLFIVYDKFIAPSNQLSAIEDSRSYAMFSGPRADLESALPSENEAPVWLSQQFENITKHCVGSSQDV